MAKNEDGAPKLSDEEWAEFRFRGFTVAVEEPPLAEAVAESEAEAGERGSGVGHDANLRGLRTQVAWIS